MSFDTHINLLVGTVQTPPAPLTTGPDLTLMPGDAARFQPSMPVTLVPPNVQPTHDNSEIAYITAINGSVLTLLRAQEGTTAMQVVAGWQVIGSLTAKTVTDIEVAIVSAADKHFEQAFNVASSVTVNHNLGKRPAVTVVDSAGDEVTCDVIHLSDASFTASWPGMFSGTIFCN